MSIPKNHHYVSQCHQSEFFNFETGKIYLYDKELNNFYFKRTTKSLFSELQSNSRIINGEMDNQSLETELKILFEDDLPEHIRKIKSFVLIQENHSEVYELLGWVALLGILGELRHPGYKRELDEAMASMEKEINQFLDKGDRIAHLEKKTPHGNDLGYIMPALRILERMEPLEYQIYSIESDDHFLLPDNSAIQLRGQLQHYRNNLIHEIIQVGIPITDKIFVLATSTKLNADLRKIYFIKDNDSDIVFEFNENIYKHARKAVACKDEEFLRKTVGKIRSNR